LPAGVGIMMLAAGGSASADPSFTGGGKLTVCTDATFPPMEYVAQTGDKEPVGFDVDLMKALADHWHAKLDIVVIDFSGLLPGLEAKRCDAVVSGIFLTEKRLKNFDGAAYLSTASVLVGKAGTAPIAGTDELSGKTVAVQTGTDFVKWMDDINVKLKAAGKPAAEVQLYPKASDVIQQVLLGRAFAGFTQDTEVAFRALQNPGQLVTVYTFPDRQKFGIYVRKEGQDAVEVDKALDALRSDGTLSKLVESWKLAPEQLDVAK
jgi:polar amino acid transport system substrate-binding protein